MTNKMAIRYLSPVKSFMKKHDFDRHYIEALDIAIKALEERQTGEWINQEQGTFYPIECSNCHNQPFCNDEGYVLSNFCPNCGADMRYDGDEE